MSLTLFLAVLAALSVLLIMFALVGRGGADPVQARLTQLGTMQAKTLEDIELQQPFFDRSIRPLALKLSGIGQRFTSPKKARGTEQRLARAGNPYDMRTVDFLGLKVVVAGATAGLMFLLVGLVGRNLSMGLLVALAGGGIGFIAPEIWLSRRIKARRKAILLNIPDALDLLTISVRAGLGFDAALAKVVEKMSGPLIDEFQRALAELRVGKARKDALRDIVARTQVPALTSFIGAIIQAETLG
ncbi:MAG: type II secretion system F family protein, partial [Chloroflexi bacterium]|nr:type II secretion system F family protein [Chloroflexota bacterium]